LSSLVAGYLRKERQDPRGNFIFAAPPAASSGHASSGPGWRQRSGTRRWPRQSRLAGSRVPRRKQYLRRNTGDLGGLRRTGAQQFHFCGAEVENQAANSCWLTRCIVQRLHFLNSNGLSTCACRNHFALGRLNQITLAAPAGRSLRINMLLVWINCTMLVIGSQSKLDAVVGSERLNH
jgi:hypothetical protein